MRMFVVVAVGAASFKPRACTPTASDGKNDVFRSMGGFSNVSKIFTVLRKSLTTNKKKLITIPRSGVSLKCGQLSLQLIRFCTSASAVGGRARFVGGRGGGGFWRQARNGARFIRIWRATARPGGKWQLRNRSFGRNSGGDRARGSRRTGSTRPGRFEERLVVDRGDGSPHATWGAQ